MKFRLSIVQQPIAWHDGWTPPWAAASPSTTRGADRAGVVTAPLDLAALRAWREKFPAHLDADAFILES